MNVEKLIANTTQMIALGLTTKEIRSILLREGCDEGLAFLVFSAARIFLRDLR